MVVRATIDKTTLNTLLLNKNFTCCFCLGDKGLTFIVHHIEEYQNIQDNSYENLAVLCPTCHDLANSARLLTLSEYLQAHDLIFSYLDAAAVDLITNKTQSPIPFKKMV